ncbi:MAG: methionyl-tRNA formyltransferase [Candidatus Omnitrophica bacterium]|nr:methionyl-tRNA formyltransferase [Candidatus Omnitrophota bacterium]
MKIVFFGSSEFARRSLRALVEAKHEVALVVTQPDKPRSRGLALGGTAIKDEAAALGLAVYQPESVNSASSMARLEQVEPDLFVIIAYGQKFSEKCLAIPRIMPVNVHASLLPKYRGAAPINRAIMNGETRTGNSVMKVTPLMDAGPVILQSCVAIEPSDTAITLEEKLAADAPGLLLKALRMIGDQTARLTPQDESQKTFAPKLTAETIRIRWESRAEEIRNLVRASLSWSCAYTTCRGKRLKIYAVFCLSPDVKPDVAPGTVTEVSAQGICVACGRGIVCITEVQLEGKKRLAACDFLAGFRLEAGERLGR